MTDELLHCPFCGDDNIEIVRYGTVMQSCICSCTNCGCTVESNELGAGKAWNTRHTPDVQAAINDETQNPWKSAIIDELVVDYIYSAEYEADPRKALADVIEWNVQVALDPRVSADARKLQQDAIDAALESVALVVEDQFHAPKTAIWIRSRIGTNPLADLQAQLDKANARVKELERSLEITRRDHDAMMMDAVRLAEEKSALTAQLAEAQARIAELEELLKEAYSDADDVLRPRIEELAAALCWAGKHPEDCTGDDQPCVSHIE